MGVLRMAWRNIGRNRRRTGVTVAAMTLALFVMVVYGGLMQGMLGDMERSILETEIGDLPETVDALLTGRVPPPDVSRKSQGARIPIDLLAALSDDREPLADLG